MNYEDIVNFLLARIADDEAMARAADVKQGDPSWRASKHVEGATVRSGRDNRPMARVQYLPSDEDDGPCSTGIIDPHAVANHIARHDPVRVLAECAAKRAIVSDCRWTEPTDCALHPEHRCWDDEHDFAVFEYGVLCELATVYADHPDFNKKWKY